MPHTSGIAVPRGARVVQALVLEPRLAGHLLQGVLDAPQVEVGAVVAVHQDPVWPEPAESWRWESVHVRSQEDLVVRQEVRAWTNQTLLAVHVLVITRLSVGDS